MLLEIFYLITSLLSAMQTFETKIPYHPKPFKSCFEQLGCFSTNELWYDEEKRPINLEPLDRFTIRTNFILYKKNETDRLIYDTMTAKESSIEMAGFAKGQPVIFLIHDFTANGFTGWIKHFAKAALKETSNVVSVDWEAGAEPPYAQAVSNARVVALEIVAFIKTIKTFGICAKKINMVGHGVGAHIAGYVGAEISDINKITALDPAGPYFEGMPAQVKLDKSDATFVEVLHTDAYYPKSEGTLETMGHVDFYANNAALQPGCPGLSEEFPPVSKLDRNSLKEGQILPDCSHKRAFKYYIEAFEKPDCKFLGIPCQDHNTFAEGKCTSCSDNSCVYLAESKLVVSSKKLFFNTRDKSPYCMFTYIMEISISQHSKQQTGKFEMMLVGGNDKVSNATGVTGKQIMKYDAGKTYSQVFYASPFKVQDVKEAQIKWIHKASTFCVLFCDNGIHVKEVLVRLLIKDGICQKSRLCPVKADGKIASGSYMKFVKCEEGKG